MRRNSRKNDPPTSVIAGRDIEASGITRRHRAVCLDAVTRSPGLTAREVEDRTGIKAHKRLPELRGEGVVSNGQARTCTVSGRHAMTWYPGTQKTNASAKGERKCR